MEEMTLRVPVNIKARVTAALKEKLAADINEALKNVELELQQLEFHAKRMLHEQEKADPQALPQLRSYLDNERIKRLDFRREAQDRLEHLGRLETGAEIGQGTLDRTVTLKIGDDLHKLMGAEILLEDGKIVAFRM